MTLDTRIYIHGPAEPREVHLFCNRLIGAHENVKMREEPGEICNAPGQGFKAWLITYHGNGGWLVPEGGHHRYCEVLEDEPDTDLIDPDCQQKKCRPAWIEVSLDTTY